MMTGSRVGWVAVSTEDAFRASKAHKVEESLTSVMILIGYNVQETGPKWPAQSPSTLPYLEPSAPIFDTPAHIVKV
jgi:hypothetical protein